MPFDGTTYEITSPVTHMLAEGKDRVQRGWCQQTMRQRGSVCIIGSLKVLDFESFVQAENLLLDAVNLLGYPQRTVRDFNAACRADVPFNPNILDGRRTRGLAVDKTNWANPLDTPPFHAYHVTTGVTFTFGGLKISKRSEVEDLYGRIIPGLYAAGEMVGGLFFHNYASGTGLMSGATFGRLAGRSAAEFARQSG